MTVGDSLADELAAMRARTDARRRRSLPRELEHRLDVEARRRGLDVAGVVVAALDALEAAERPARLARARAALERYARRQTG